MNDQERSTSTEQAASHPQGQHEPKHQFEHAPTVIHDPEEDMTLLAKWLKHGMEKGPAFWGTGLVLLAVVVCAALYFANASSGGSPEAEAWSELIVAKTSGRKIEIADEHPTTEAARIARLQAASELYFDATRELPASKDVALPLFRKALDQFELVVKDAPEKSPEALSAAMGVARTHEARNELAEAIQQYKVVVQKWPGSPEAKEAERLAAALQDPQVVAFYKDLYEYKSPTAVLPPGGSTNIPLPGLPANHPDLNGPTIPAPGSVLSLPPILPSQGTPATTSPPTSPTPPLGGASGTPDDLAPPPATNAPLPTLPKNPFAKPDAPKSK